MTGTLADIIVLNTLSMIAWKITFTTFGGGLNEAGEAKKWNGRMDKSERDNPVLKMLDYTLYKIILLCQDVKNPVFSFFKSL